MAKKNIPTKLTIQNLTAEIKKTFAKKTALEEVKNLAAAAFKSGTVQGNTVKLFTSGDASGEAAFSFDFPTEFFLDQAQSKFVQNFAWSEETYPGSANPNLDGKPVMVLALKGDNEGDENDTLNFSFVDLTYLLNTYKAAAGDGTTTVNINGYDIGVNVNVSAEEGNALVKKGDGLYVPTTDLSGKADKVVGATEGNLAALDANGNLTDSGKKAGDFVEKVFVDGVEDAVLHESDISDYTAEEIAAMLADDAAE